ncbi:MAG: hypothetical protein P1U53_10030, partial [Sulfitobacter sp.]|nr:hypothetical protein [Sulfitobacter sp.]
MSQQLQQIVLASRPDGAPTPDNFRLEKADMPTPGEGEILVEVSHMSLDPYMRGRMDDAKSYAQPVPIDGKMEGGGVGRVIASNSSQFKEGDHVFGMFGWATHSTADARMCRKLDPDQALTVWDNDERLAQATAGLSIHALMQLLKGAVHQQRTLSQAMVLEKVAEYITSQLGEDMVEFK